MRSPTLDEKIGLALERQEKIPERVRRCTTHHHACDCREYEFEQAKARIEALEKASNTAVADYKRWVLPQYGAVDGLDELAALLQVRSDE